MCRKSNSRAPKGFAVVLAVALASSACATVQGSARARISAPPPEKGTLTAVSEPAPVERPRRRATTSADSERPAISVPMRGARTEAPRARALLLLKTPPRRRRPTVARALAAYASQLSVDGADIVHVGGQREPIQVRVGVRGCG